MALSFMQYSTISGKFNAIALINRKKLTIFLDQKLQTISFPH